MSAPSTRRVKDRNGVVSVGLKPIPTATTNASKTLTPISNPNSALKKSLSGKENPRSISRAQKPEIRPVPRVDKAAAAAAARAGSDGREGNRMRWSTSSAPTRGRSQSPSEFIRVFRDSKIGRGGGEVSRVVPLCSAGKRNGGLVKKVGILESNKENSHGFSVLNAGSSKEVKLISNLIKSTESESVRVSNFGSKVPYSVKLDKSCVDKCESGRKDTGLNEEGKGSNVGCKYPSKLHEKLAFLEGKVKRIASDIKRTKEMIDMNNPDSSKLILSDIQDKISGIEKVMGNVAGNPSLKSGGENKVGEKGVDVKVDDPKGGSVKGLNGVDLEARLLPHHKLLRERITLKGSLGNSHCRVESNVFESSLKLKEEKMLNPVEENQIANEFLASLGIEDAKVTTRHTIVRSEAGQVQETDGAAASEEKDTLNTLTGTTEEDLLLTADETLDEFDDQETKNTLSIGEEGEDTIVYQVNEIGSKSSTAGWFVSEGEAVLLAHDNGSCSFYDIANCEEKAVYNPPVEVSPNIWKDCWILRAPSADGCSGRYVVAASAGNTVDSGFCSWDFYTKDVQAFHIEDGGTTAQKTILGPLPTNPTYRRNSLSSLLLPSTQQWWYKPCGPLIISTASSQRLVKVHDIRDGELVMKWDVQKPVSAMDYSSPLQWRNRGKVVVAETETISVWDVNSIKPEPLSSVSLSGRRISALHIINTDAELGGGVRQRATSAESVGNDGVFCTADSINVLDFRNPSGVGLKIPKVGVSMQSVFTRGSSVYVGCSNLRSSGKKHPCSQVQQFSLRQQRLVCTYTLPESNTNNSAITQVWGNSNFVMAASTQGLFVFDASEDDTIQLKTTMDSDANQEVKDVIDSEDLCSFDYLSSRVLLVSRDRPAMWKHLV